jgi:hypothetical protein
MNSSVLENRIRKSQVLQNLYLNTGTLPALADAITLRVLSRRATPQEIDLYTRYMQENKISLMETAIDIMWMQMNSNEFLYNH